MLGSIVSNGNGCAKSFLIGRNLMTRLRNGKPVRGVPSPICEHKVSKSRRFPCVFLSSCNGVMSRTCQPIVQLAHNMFPSFFGVTVVVPNISFEWDAHRRRRAPAGTPLNLAC